MSTETALKSYSYPKAGELLGVSHATVFRMVKAGRVKTVKLMGLPRIPHTEIERILREALCESTTEN